MSEEYGEFLEFAMSTAREAGKLLLTFHERQHTRSYKEACHLKTEADDASDKLIRERIRVAYPEHSIISEESDDFEKIGRAHV